jgi:ferredoxin-type protein NapF
VATSINRIQLLRGDLRGSRQIVRPPWAPDEFRFVDTCERCDACIAACSETILKRGQGGFPEVDFSQGGCTFCGDCVKACTHGVLAFFDDLEQAPWNLIAQIQDNCLSLNGVVCRSCGEACDDSVIRFKLEIGGKARPLLDETECTGCGECIAICPTQSIQIHRLPETAVTEAQASVGGAKQA